MRRTIAVLALVAVFALTAVPLMESEGSELGDAKGISLDYYSPSDKYTMKAVYYEDDVMRMAFTSSLDPSSSEIGHNVFILLKDSTAETIVRSSDIPTPMDEDLTYLGLCGEQIPDGLYRLEIHNTSMQLIVGCYLYIGEVHEIEFKDTEGKGSIEPNDPVIVPHNTEFVLEDNAMVLDYQGHRFANITATPPEGFSFGGWFSDNIKINNGDKVVDEMTGEKQIEARWSCLFRIHFDPNGGSSEPGDLVYEGSEAEHTFVIPTMTPIREGYLFKGWSTTVAGAAEYSPGSEITLQSSEPSKTLYAVWEYQPTPPGPTDYRYKVIYNANGGTGAPSDQSYTGTERSHTFTIPSPIPVREGFTFHGWSDSATGAAIYQPGGSITLQYISPTKTLYAVWSETPVIPDIDDFSFNVDEIIIPSGMKYVLPFTIEPPAAIGAVTWESSDDRIATVSGGTINAIKEGAATVTAYDRDGSVLDSITITVTSPGQKEVEEKTDTEDGGSVIATYEIDDEGNKILVNPIVINPGDLKKITDDQVELAGRYIDTLVQSGTDPHMVVPTDEQSVGVPAELLEMIADGNGSLTVIEGDVTVLFPSDVIVSLGTDQDLEFCFVSVDIEDVDIGGLKNAKVYDLYILKNGSRVTQTFPSSVTVIIDYAMKEGWTPDRLSVWYLDVEPRVSIEFEYVKGEGVMFGVMHFSHYAVSYDEEKTPADGCCVWCWILILAVIVLILFLLWFFLARRFTVTLDLGEGKILMMPDGWEADSDSVLVRRFRYNGRLEMPNISLGDGHAIQRWTPEPEERVKGSVTYAAVIGERESLAPAEEPHGE